jgi:O-antigen/teichoic acid export membrane protein
MFAGQGLGYFLRVIYFVMIARLLGVLQYGIVVGAFALVNMVAEYGRLGTGMVFLRYVSADRNQFSIYWGNVLLVTASMSGLLIVILKAIAPHLIDPASAAIIVLMATGSCLCEQLTVSSTQVFQAFDNMRIAALLNLLTSLVRALTAGGMLLLLHHATAREWAIASTVGSIVATVIALTLVTVHFGLPHLAPRLFMRRGVEGLEYAFASSTTNAYNDLDKTMLSHYGMSAANGIYAMAYRVIDMATMPIASIQLATEPRLFQLGAAGIKDAAILGDRLLKRALLMSTATAAGMFLLAPLIPWIVGRGFAEAEFALRWLCIIPVFRSVHGITGSVLTCVGLQRYRTLTQVIAAVMNFGLNLWLIPHYGWQGAAWASLATDGALGAMNWSVLEWARNRPSRYQYANASH